MTEYILRVELYTEKGTPCASCILRDSVSGPFIYARPYCVAQHRSDDTLAGLHKYCPLEEVKK